MDAQIIGDFALDTLAALWHFVLALDPLSVGIGSAMGAGGVMIRNLFVK